MSAQKIKTWATLCALALLSLSPRDAVAGLTGPGTPPGFSLVLSAPGTALYRRYTPDGGPDYVLVVSLRQGARVKLLHGAVASPGTGQGVYGGDNPAFWRQTLQEAWREFSVSYAGAFCIADGAFFSEAADPASLAFPLKQDGVVVSDGYGLDEYPNQKLMLELWGDKADIASLSKDALYSSSAPDIVAGLSEAASGAHPNKPTGRTFVGIADSDRDGIRETVLIFSSRIATKTEAAAALRSFGAEKVMMLDGGSSAQLRCQGISYVSAGRKIPQTIAVVSSAAEPSAAPVARRPDRLVGAEEAFVVHPRLTRRVLWVR